MKTATKATNSSVTIVVTEEFSPTPLGRYKEDGKYNGTKFRQQFLMPALTDESITRVEVDLNNLILTGSSFIEESFGGLVRDGLSEENINKLHIITDREDLILEINAYIKEALASRHRNRKK